MKNLFLLFFILLTFSCALKAQKKLSVAFIGGAGHTFVTKSLQNQSWQNTSKFFLGGRFGANISVHVDEKNAFTSGLRVSTTGYRSYVTGIKWGSEHDGNGGWKRDPNLPHEGIVTSRDYWLETPIIFHHNFKVKKWTTYIETGVLFSTPVAQSSKFFGEKANGAATHTFTTVKPFRNYAIGFIGSLGLERNFTKNKTFFVQSSFNTNVFSTQQVLGPQKLKFIKSSMLLALETGVRFSF